MLADLWVANSDMHGCFVSEDLTIRRHMSENA